MNKIEKFDHQPTCTKCATQFALAKWGMHQRQVFLDGTTSTVNHVAFLAPFKGKNEDDNLPSRLCIFCPVCGHTWFMHPADRTAADIERLYTEPYLPDDKDPDKVGTGG